MARTEIGTDPISVLKWGLSLFLLLAAPALGQEQVLKLPNGQELRYRLVTEAAESAKDSATRMLRHLAAGEIEAAAALSNAPERRLEVLRDYERSVGDEEFKRIFSRYFAPGNRLFLEAAIGANRLLVWDLGEAGNALAGQYYVEVDGRYLLDDAPNENRANLQRVLEALRKKTRN